MLARLPRRGWYGLLGVGPLLLALAFLPSVTYIDHWGEFLASALGRANLTEEAESPLQEVAHEAHCHAGAAGCSDLPAPIGRRVLPPIVELETPTLPAVLLEAGDSPLNEVVLSPPTDPPRL